MQQAILVMGTAGSGKSTLGAQLARALGAVFLEGDDFHPPENVAHMAAGHALSDDMRWPWLDRLAQAAADQKGPVVIACSALRRAYRDRLRAALPGLVLVYPEVPRDLIEHRMAARQDHFMPVSLLDSQFATLEPPGPDEAPLVVSGDQPIAAMVAQAHDALRDRFVQGA